MKEKGRNIAASVRQRLLNARKGTQDFQRLLARYAIERFLYRLSQSAQRDRFVLKGAMLFALWSKEPFRSTGDLDLLGFGANDIETLRSAFAAICGQAMPDDGLTFDADTIEIEAMREEEEYRGARVRLKAKLGTAVIPIQIDIGSGDIIHPAPAELDYPLLLPEFPAARIRAYPPETVIAEKLEAMVRFDEFTSRLKDHYDIWALSHAFTFKKAELAAAVRKTFQHRGTALPSETPTALSDAFAARPDKQTQWEAFLRRTAPTVPPPPFAELVGELRRFVEPVIAGALAEDRAATGEWHQTQGWV
jgi:hypothetical protein